MRGRYGASLNTVKPHAAAGGRELDLGVTRQVSGIESSGEPVRVGVIFSNSGASADIEAAFLKGAIVAVDVVNRRGGIRGHPIEIVYCDPGCEAARYPALVSDLVLRQGVTCIFGCVSSLCRKAALPVIERLGALLWYPTQFEGFEYSRNVLYGGPCPNQHVMPLFDYLHRNGCRRYCLIGSDFLFSRESLRVFRERAEARSAEILDEAYLGLAASGQAFLPVLRRALSLRPDAIVSAVVPPALLDLFRAYRFAGGNPFDVPLANMAASELDAGALGFELSHGHIAVGPYFETVHNAENAAFLAALRRRYGQASHGNMSTALAYDQMLLFARAAERANSIEMEPLVEAAHAVDLASPRGRIHLDAETNCTYSWPRIGMADSSGRYAIMAETEEAVAPDPFLITYA